jgi:UDP-N-acetylmuramoyl-L-alanyl-D-glutamate--2,6-diaminopimelate ligase
MGISLEAVGRGLGAAGPVRGRLEQVVVDAPFGVYVDYAHTDDAMSAVLGTLRPLTTGRLICVFGCGGDRDTAKRPRMGRVAGDGADRCVLTSDNPRSEDPDAIIAQVAAGVESGGDRLLIEPDRRAAIRLALEMADPGDVVLIAGKGHETGQIVGDEQLPFDDVQVAQELWQEISGAGISV